MDYPARIAERRSERLIEELLDAQGWDLRRPPAGELLTQHEYKDYGTLREALAKASKSGPGSGTPEFVLIERGSMEPLAVFEAKAKVNEIDRAAGEACGYGEAFIQAGFSPLAVGVAGTKDDTFEIRVFRHSAGSWIPVTYEGRPIAWIPNRGQVAMLQQVGGAAELRPAVPPPTVLKARAEEINGLLREAGLKDDFRPAVIGAIMLALWKSGGNLRRDSRFILPDVNQACERAFVDAKKPDLSKSLHVDEANAKLAVRAKRICQILERLNITTLTAEHDYIGALYEEFFRYTGGNTIGQYFTPRHITSLMAEMCDVTRDDVVLDPACGTGGFLIAAMERMQQQAHLPRDQIVKIVKTKLFGMDDEPVTAALCVANMILRGDGSTGVSRADCFDDNVFPFSSAHVVLMNPPFPHKQTDIPPERFISRALQGLKHRGTAAIIIPSSLLGASKKSSWRKTVLRENRLLAVITLPNELFQPYAASTTAIVVFEHGVPHGDSNVYFGRITNDGFRLRKGVRIPQPHGDQIPALLTSYRGLTSISGFCAVAKVTGDDWAPGAYIEAEPLSDTQLRDGVATLIRDKMAFIARYAPQLAASTRAIAAGELQPITYTRPGRQPGPAEGTQGTTIRDLFYIYYGQQELESKDHLSPGVTLVISSTGADNGAYGFFDFPDLIKAPFVTVPRTGSIGEARVQEFPCAATSDCLLLIPKAGTATEALYIAAATLRAEAWRFDYSRKMTPRRIANFPLRLDPGLLAWIHADLAAATDLQRAVLSTLGHAEGVDNRGE